MHVDQSVIPDDEEWCFFNKPSPKYANSGRTDRTTKAGFWKVTGKDLPISDDSGEQVIGFKKTLVFYRGRGSNAVKTSWVIHEYHTKNASANYQAFPCFPFVYPLNFRIYIVPFRFHLFLKLLQVSLLTLHLLYYRTYCGELHASEKLIG